MVSRYPFQQKLDGVDIKRRSLKLGPSRTTQQLTAQRSLSSRYTAEASIFTLEKQHVKPDVSVAPKHSFPQVGARYLDHLVLERQYGKAAQLCPKLLKGNAAAWERWVFHFASLRQLPALAPYIPTANPQLRETVYEVRGGREASFKDTVILFVMGLGVRALHFDR